jgi:ERCC4-type nuclease
MSKIIIDYREKDIIKELTKKHLDIEVKSLIAADVIIQVKDFNNNIKELGIERKTQSDFLNSIIDKRILNQLISLKENFALQLLIIEGPENIYRIRDFHPNAIRGMLSSIAIDFQVPILHTESSGDTAALLEMISRRLDKPKRDISLLTKRKPPTLKEQQEFIIESIPSVGPTLAKSLLKEFKSVKNIINAPEEKLRDIDKIGPATAKKIKELTDSKYE